MNNIVIRQTIYFILYVLVQAFFIKRLALFEVAFCFLYVNFILMLPDEIENILLILISFALGLSIDTFYGTLGTHSAACTVVGYARPTLIRVFLQRDKVLDSRTRNFNLGAFSSYVLAALFLHHTFVLLIEAGGWNNFGLTFIKIITSIIFTFVVILIVRFLFYSSKET